MSKTKAPNDASENVEEIKEELEEQLEEIEEQLEEAETPEELSEIEKQIEGIKSWVTETLIGPITALTVQMSRANELKAQAMERGMKGATPAQGPQDQSQEPPEPEQTRDPESLVEQAEEAAEEIQETAQKMGRKIVPL